MADNNTDSGYSLLMPFIVCQSRGGPYDDDAYVAGWECGVLDTILGGGPMPWPVEHTQLIHSANQPQVDLIAMKHGYSAEYSDEGEGWTTVKLRRNRG